MDTPQRKTYHITAKHINHFLEWVYERKFMLLTSRITTHPQQEWKRTSLLQETIYFLFRKNLYGFNSMRSDDAYTPWWTVSSFQVFMLWLVTCLLPSHYLNQCWLSATGQTSWNLNQRTSFSRKCIQKYCLQNDCHFADFPSINMLK